MDDQPQSIRDRFRKHSPELGLLLWAVWAPIGVDVPLSEYEGYVPTVWRMLEEDASVSAIATELARISAESMVSRRGRTRMLRTR